jgi:hypothetical protein
LLQIMIEINVELFKELMQMIILNIQILKF